MSKEKFKKIAPVCMFFGVQTKFETKSIEEIANNIKLIHNQFTQANTNMSVDVEKLSDKTS